MIVKNRLNFFDRLILWINYLFCTALILSYLAPYIDPRKLWIIAFFGLAYPPLLLGNLLLIVYWLLRKRLPLMFISAVTILAGYNIILNNIGFRTGISESAVKPGDAYIRMMTYNVHNFKKFGSKNDASTKHEILEIILKQQPDIIGFQEYFTKHRGQYAMTDSIRRILNTTYSFCKLFMENSEQGMGMSIFSKFPIVDQGIVYLSEQTNPNQCIWIDVNRAGQIFRFYSIHLRSINFEPEDYKYLDSVSKKGKADLKSSRRIGGKLKSAFLKRSEQMFIVKQHANACPYPYLISGDFNDTPSSFAVNQMGKGLKNAFREKGSGLGRTYNGDFPNYQIDFVFASNQFNIGTYKIIEQKLSDHYPIRCDLLLNTPGAATPADASPKNSLAN